jgi:DNA processing protein
MLMQIYKESAPNYPAKLMALTDPPKQLYISGDLANWQALYGQPMVAVVGSRKQTNYGRDCTETIVRQLVARGVVIVSGLALGIDATAHKAALAAGGRTIAVLPSGFSHIYPSSHHGLARQIVNSGGALVSEYEPSAEIAFKSNFIARNRIIAGLADVVLITEAAVNSGSLHTANFALDIGRDIFAVPGPITSPGSVGCHNLIKTGAFVADSAADILNKLHISATEQAELPLLNDKNQSIILQHLSAGPLAADDLRAELAIPVAQLNQALSMLEIYGHIKPVGNNIWAIA